MEKISRKGFLKVAAAAAMSGVTAGALAACNAAGSSSTAASGDAIYTAGTYTGTATGIGEVKVTMTFSETAITELVKSCGGYFESKSLSNRSSGYRYGEFTVRVPAAEYEHFCEQVGSLCHVTYMSSSAENITEEYYDTDSRLKTAQIKLERLQELLSKADNMADIITIESAISDTEYELSLIHI